MIANPMVVGLSIGLLAASYPIWSHHDIYRMIFGPVYGFSWGELEKTIIEWNDIRRSVFWCIVVALPLAILANIISSFWGTESQKATDELADGANKANAADSQTRG